jgi:hypothetical protein
MALLLLKIFSFNIYSLLHSIKLIFKTFFPLWNEVPLKQVGNLNASTALSGNEKRSKRVLFLMCANKKKSLGDRSGEYGQFDVVTGQKLDSSFCCVSACMALALSR